MHIKLLSVAKVQIKPKTTSKKTIILNKNNFISLQRVVFGLFSEINRVLFRQLADYCSACSSTALTQMKKTGREFAQSLYFVRIGWRVGG